MAKKSRSVLKRIRQNEKRRLRNKHWKSMIKTFSKKVIEFVKQGDSEKAAEALRQAVKVIYKAKSKGVIHRNTAARKVSKLSKLVASLQQGRA